MIKKYWVDKSDLWLDKPKGKFKDEIQVVKLSDLKKEIENFRKSLIKT